MLSVRGVFNGKKIEPLEEFNVPGNAEVIITFLDRRTSSQSTDDKTRDLIELSGTWEDDRSVEEIVMDIYESRTTTQKDVTL